ncbi:GTP-binding protein [Candidatus Geothermarchaeota archaeon]|nr:MAG: GTP-binding protein [Candidatus Geothermarchaeota archaeon]
MRRASLTRIIKEADLILEVVDIRDPLSTRSEFVERLVKKLGKKLIIVLNKCDLVPVDIAREWRRIFSSKGLNTVLVAANTRSGIKTLKRGILRIVKSMRKPVKVAVVGVPKVGKSTIINALKGKSSAQTSPYPGSPGYTKGVQLLRIGEGIYLLDTPGIAPLKKGIEGIIRGRPIEQLPDPVKAAVILIHRIIRHSPHAFKIAYGIDEMDPEEILKALAVKRGWFYKKDKEPLIDEAARTVIRDYLRGKIPFFLSPNKT